MFSRHYSFIALAAGAFAVASPAAAPVTTRYLIETTTEQELDATAAGGPKQTTHMRMRSFVTITLNDTTGGRTMHAVLDSMKLDSTTSPLPAGMLDSLRGVAYHGLLTSDGALADLTPMKTEADNPIVRGLFNDFFPRVRPNVKSGDSWTDTTDATSPVPNGTMSTRTVTNYTATPGETRAGVKTLKVGAAFSSALTGTQETPQGTANIGGTGTGTGTYFVAPDGRYLGGDVSQTTALSIEGLAPAPIPLNMKQQIKTSVLQ